MKKILMGTVALVALGLAVPANAADLGARQYTKAPVAIPAPIYNWTGFYIGGHIGGSFRGDDNNLLGGSSDGTFLGGVQAGYDGWADSRFSNGFGGNGGRDGYTVGGGLEYLFTQNWSGKIEYQYYDFGTVNFITPAAVAGSFRNDEHTIKVGLNYRFGWGAPVVAKY
ncbi:MAG: porin family protein [Rhizobiales bacterium]|nr:porin family protein [Hyphomicrobiales bacterium]